MIHINANIVPIKNSCSFQQIIHRKNTNINLGNNFPEIIANNDIKTNVFNE